MRKLLTLTTCVALALVPAGRATADVGSRLKDLADAYQDVFGQYPSAYTCELRSPELVASLEPPAREAWGGGHIRMTRDGQTLRLEAEDLARPDAAPWFNAALGLWQLKLGAELSVLESRLPQFFLATALGALTRYRGFEEPEGRHLRFGLLARGDQDPIREASFLVADGHAIRELRIENRDGGSVVAKVGNLPAPGESGRWLVSEIEATVTQPGGKIEVWSASLGYVPVGDHLLFEHILLKGTDAEGNLLRRRPNDVNPISYYFSNCSLLPARH